MAGRIPQHFLDDLLDRTDIVDLIGSFVKLKKTGSNYSACCPFHQEKTPSFSVSPTKQFYYCFGCGAGGNALSFLIAYQQTDFRTSVEYLAKQHGMALPNVSDEEVQEQKTRSSLYELLDQASAFYQAQLTEHPQKAQAISYLKQRGLSGETTKQFGIGFAPNDWENLKTKLGTSNHAIEGLITTGMLIQKEDSDRTYDRFRNRLMFPIRDMRGRTIAFGGRVFDDSKPKYLNSPESPTFHKQRTLYGLYEIKQYKQYIDHIIVTEGYMDVVALAQAGIHNAVATLGTACSSYHIEQIFRLCPTVIFCFDGDKAGRKAADRALESVLPYMQAGKQAKFLFLPEGEDPDSLVKKQGKKHIEHLIETSQSLSEYLFDEHSTGLSLSKADDKAMLISRLSDLIGKMPEGGYKALMQQELSQKTALPIEDIRQLATINQEDNPYYPTPSTPTALASSNPTPSPATQPTADQTGIAPPSTPKLLQAELTTLRLLLMHPEIASEPHPLESIETPSTATQFILRLIEYITEHPKKTPASLIGHWLAHEKKLTEQALHSKLPEPNENQRLRTYKDCLTHISKQNHRTNVKSFIEITKLNANLTLNDMSVEEREAYLKLFSSKSSD